MELYGEGMNGAGVRRHAVIFDMDGVLLDSYHAHWLSWVKSCADRGISITPEQYKGLFGRSFRAFADALSPRPLSDGDIHAWYDDKERQYREIITRDFPAMPGASDLIQALHAAGFLLGVGSSGPRGNVDCMLRHLPGAERFKATVSANETRNCKPHPEPFLTCAAALGVEPSCCVVIEDSTHGLKAARAAGMGAVGITGTCSEAELCAQADLVVTALSELTPERVADLVPSGSSRAV